MYKNKPKCAYNCLKTLTNHIQTHFGSYWKHQFWQFYPNLGLCAYSVRGAPQTPPDADFWWFLLIFDHFLMIFGHKWQENAQKMQKNGITSIHIDHTQHRHPYPIFLSNFRWFSRICIKCPPEWTHVSRLGCFWCHLGWFFDDFTS